MNIVAAALNAERQKRWLDASLGFVCLGAHGAFYVQGLGQLDLDLLMRDAGLVARGVKDWTVIEASAVGELFTLSHLWVLGAYELVRAVDQKRREGVLLLDQTANRQLVSSKTKFERIRIPLAKLEAADRWKATDYSVALPEIVPAVGVAWRVSDSVVITRGELSDDLLSLGCSLKK